MGPEEPRSGTGRPLGLLALVRHFSATIVALVYTRVELLATEFEEELQRGVILFLWLMLALLFGALFVLMLAVTLLIIFWNDRVMVAALITAAFAITTAVMAYLSRAHMKQKPRFMAASLEELKRDRAYLERRR